MDQNLLDLLPNELKNITSDLMDIVLDRALTKIYQNLSEENKAAMAQVFYSGTDEEKINFIKNHFGNLQTIVIEETQKLIEEIKNK